MKKAPIGPAILVTAAFIGPGTVFTASLAGANFGFALLWALIFSTIATIILQSMTARLALVTGNGLGENINQSLKKPISRFIGFSLIIAAIIIGNAAYQGGNISGASIGLSGAFPAYKDYSSLFPALIGIIAFVVLWHGRYRLIEKALLVLVLLMSSAFVITVIIVKPDFYEIFNAIIFPKLPEGSVLTAIALIGTTVVPYNLFLHASSLCQKGQSIDNLADAKKDIVISISIGGLISMCILSTAATVFFSKQIVIHTAADLAPALQPLFGDYATLLMSLGLFSAGISSAITAPLAAAFALGGLFNLKNDLKSKYFKCIWIFILLLGVLVALSGYKPVSIIWFAQVANGFLLPLIVVYLLWIMNTRILKQHKNNFIQNTLGALVLLVTILLSGRSLLSAFGLL
ncbi:MAG: manganese transport protein [Polaribacter sp.]|jgi:manganese transport protein